VSARQRLALIAVATFTVLAIASPDRTDAASRANCEIIVAELREQGASASVAHWLGRVVAWRESTCRPVYVRDRDDWSHSRFGLNGRTANLRRFWRQACGADVRWDTAVLSIDVRCALAAFNRLGRSPWR
jgi:hypothetical protein